MDHFYAGRMMLVFATRLLLPATIIFVSLSFCGVACPQDTTTDVTRQIGSRFGGPDAPETYLDLIERRQALDTPNYLLPGWDRRMRPWIAFKKRLETEHNLRIGGHYQVNYQKADRAVNDPDYGFGGLFRGIATWTPGGRDNPDAGRLVTTVDYRSKFGNGVVLSALGGQIGYIGTTNAILGDSHWDWVHVYWAQPRLNGTSGFALGRMDPNDFFNTHGFSSPWSGFTNNEVVNAVSVLQPQSSWGFLVGHYFSDQIYGIAGTFDANGSASDQLQWFRGGAEFWTGLELGFVPSGAEPLEKKINLTLWNVDPRDDAGIGRGHGVALTASWTYDKFNPFMRVGWSEGTAPQYNESFLIGFRHFLRDDADIVGFAFGTGKSSTGLGRQDALEAFYNHGLAENLALTFDVQRIGNPLLNPIDEEIWLLGVRLRAIF